MPDTDDDYSLTAAAVLVNAKGEMLTNIVAYDGESFHSRLSPLADIAAGGSTDEVPELYDANRWFTAMVLSKAGHLFVADGDGRVHTNVSGSWQTEDVCPEDAINAIHCSTGNTIFAAGVDGRVYRRDRDSWSAISDSFNTWINDIASFSDEDVMVVGDEGLVAQMRGSEWASYDIETNATLNGVLADKSGNYMICGANGLLLRGAVDQFEDITSADFDLYKMVHYGDEIWIACGSRGAGRLSEDYAIEIVRDTFAAYRISVDNGMIGFSGNDIVARYDGTKWAGYRYT